MSDENIIDFMARKNGGGQPPKPVEARPCNYEFHFHPSGESDEDGRFIPGEVVEAYGYLKFGPQFIAVCDGPDQEASVTFAVSTPVVQYVKKLDDKDKSIQATLSL